MNKKIKSFCASLLVPDVFHETRCHCRPTCRLDGGTGFSVGHVQEKRYHQKQEREKSKDAPDAWAHF